MRGGIHLANFHQISGVDVFFVKIILILSSMPNLSLFGLPLKCFWNICFTFFFELFIRCRAKSIFDGLFYIVGHFGRLVVRW